MQRYTKIVAIINGTDNNIPAHYLKDTKEIVNIRSLFTQKDRFLQSQKILCVYTAQSIPIAVFFCLLIAVNATQIFSSTSINRNYLAIDTVQRSYL